jgi:hypothetical protein
MNSLRSAIEPPLRKTFGTSEAIHLSVPAWLAARRVDLDFAWRIGFWVVDLILGGATLQRCIVKIPVAAASAAELPQEFKAWASPHHNEG